MRSSPDRSSATVFRKPRATSSNASVLPYTLTSGADPGLAGRICAASAEAARPQEAAVLIAAIDAASLDPPLGLKGVLIHAAWRYSIKRLATPRNLGRLVP
jgi:hypothetical protein